MRRRKLTISGTYSAHSCSLRFIRYCGAHIVQKPLGISYTGCCFVHLAEGQKMIGIIMGTKGWILLVLYLEGYLEWFVNGPQSCIIEKIYRILRIIFVDFVLI